MNQELTFYGPDSSQMVGQYADMLNADTLIHGHSPVSRLQPGGMNYDQVVGVVGNNYNGLYTDPASGVTLVNTDANLSSGMRIPQQFWTKPINGVIQVPSDIQYLPQTVVPDTLTIGPYGTYVSIPAQ